MNKSFFMVGPFADIEERLDDFSSSMYLQKLYNETIEQLIQTQMAYDVALREQNEDIADTLKTQLDFLENVVSLANNNMTSFMVDKLYYD
tara:strand:- start:178 stop:447 length:270 start_codon:yes stop_codon:yes gene_type:complete